jgi:hypothetical protein
MTHDSELELYAFMRGRLAAEDVGYLGHLPVMWSNAREAYLWFCEHELLTAEELQNCQQAFEEGYKSLTCSTPRSLGVNV